MTFQAKTAFEYSRAELRAHHPFRSDVPVYSDKERRLYGKKGPCGVASTIPSAILSGYVVRGDHQHSLGRMTATP